MQSTLTLCLIVLLNILSPINCDHVLRDIFQDSVNIVNRPSPLHPPVLNGYWLAMKRKRAIRNWVPKEQFAQTMDYYDLSSFVENLNLQHCVIVEIGEGFCALFVETLIWEDAEFKPNGSSPNEQFLGICDCATIRSWHLCRTNLQEIRREDCTFEQATNSETNSARVHRRLCDISGMALWNTPCNCSQHIAQRLLLSVTGFPTCYLPPLPDTLCQPRSVCGVYACQPIKGRRIMSVICNSSLCPGKKPFCEYPAEQTSKDRTVTSIWTPWSTPTCNSTCGGFGFMVSESVCVDSGGNPALDCIGPGSTCCSANETQCECRLIHRNDNVMIVNKLLGPCPTYTPCSVYGVNYNKRQVSRRDTRSSRTLSNSVPPNTRIKKTVVNEIEDEDDDDLLNTNALRGETGRRLNDRRFARSLYDSQQVVASSTRDGESEDGLREGERNRREESPAPFGESETSEKCCEEKTQHFSDDSGDGFKDGEDEEEPMASEYLNDFASKEERDDFRALLDEAYQGRQIDEDANTGSVYAYDEDVRGIRSRKLLSFDDFDEDDDKVDDYYAIIGDEHTISKKDLADGDFLKGLESDIDELEDATTMADNAADTGFGSGNNGYESTTEEFKDDGDSDVDDDDYDDDDDDDGSYDELDELDDLIPSRSKQQVKTIPDLDLFSPTEAALSPAEDSYDDGDEEDLDDDDEDGPTAAKGSPESEEMQRGQDGRESLMEENSAARSHGGKTMLVTVVVVGWSFLNEYF